MSVDPVIPTAEVHELCSCPVDWKAVMGFGNDRFDAISLLHLEWVKVFYKACSSSGETENSAEMEAVEGVVFSDPLHEHPSEDTIASIKKKKHLAIENYMNEIGRLGGIKFVSSIEQGKHYSISGPKTQNRKVSYFYKNLEEAKLAQLFWSWFDMMMSIDCIIRDRDGPFRFIYETSSNGVTSLWKRFREDSNFRIAMDVGTFIGELNGSKLSHLAIDLVLQADSVAHAYPITKGEAEKIMSNSKVLFVKWL